MLYSMPFHRNLMTGWKITFQSSPKQRDDSDSGHVRPLIAENGFGQLFRRLLPSVSVIPEFGFHDHLRCQDRAMGQSMSSITLKDESDFSSCESISSIIFESESRLTRLESYPFSL
jgi:hypothetical protein